MATRPPDANGYISLRADYALHQIALTDVLYVEGLDDYVKVYLQTNPRPIVARMTMKATQQKLPETGFVRVHRSFIVALSRIEAVRNKTIFIAGREIPIGARYEADFLSRFGK